MKAGDFTTVIADTRAQVAAGAHMLDVNAGIPLADEPAILAETVKLVQSLTDVPLSIDSSIVAALEAGLAVYEGKPLVNSVTGEDERIESVLPLVAKHGAAVVAITNDETGISEDPDVRFAVAKKIVRAAADHGIPAARHRGRPARDADRGDGHRRAAGVRARAPAARRARREHDVWRLERLVRAAQPQRAERRVPRDGDRERHDERDHSPLHEEVRQAVMAADVLMGTDRARGGVDRRGTARGAARAARRPGVVAGGRAAGAAPPDRRRPEVTPEP